MTNQPYNFAKGNPAGSLAQSIAGAISGGLKQRAGVQEKLMEHNMRLREIKKEGKQARKNIRTQGEVEKDVQKTVIKATGKQNRKFENAKAKASVRSAEGMARVAQGLGASAAPGTKVGISPQKAEFTTPEARSSSSNVPKPKMRPSMSRGRRGGTY